MTTYEIDYRAAEMSDLSAIREFVDFWLTGGGLRFGVEGASHDCFVPPGRHEKYVKQYTTLLALHAWRLTLLALSGESEEFLVCFPRRRTCYNAQLCFPAIGLLGQIPKMGFSFNELDMIMFCVFVFELGFRQ